MNTLKNLAIVLAVFAVFVSSARGQGFLNLDFESAHNLPGNTGEYGASVGVTNALPAWAAYNDTALLFDIYYESNVLGNGSAVELEGGSLALNGNFSVGIFGISSITQTGLVPGNAEALQFDARISASSSLSVTIGGKALSFSALSVGSDYTVYGANIPAAMDGQTENLTFLGQGSAGVVLDNIEFSTSSVPEPAELALIGVWVVLFGFCARLRGGYTAAWRRDRKIRI